MGAMEPCRRRCRGLLVPSLVWAAVILTLLTYGTEEGEEELVTRAEEIEMDGMEEVEVAEEVKMNVLEDENPARLELENRMEAGAGVVAQACSSLILLPHIPPSYSSLILLPRSSGRGVFLPAPLLPPAAPLRQPRGGDGPAAGGAAPPDLHTA